MLTAKFAHKTVHDKPIIHRAWSSRSGQFYWTVNMRDPDQSREEAIRWNAANLACCVLNQQEIEARHSVQNER